MISAEKQGEEDREGPNISTLSSLGCGSKEGTLKMERE